MLPETGELNRALVDVEQRRRTKDDLAARKGASEDFDRNYLAAIGRVAEALLRMAGKDTDAYCIHPSTQHGRELATVRSRTHDPPSLAS